MSKDYAAERQDPRWQRKRLEIMERDRFQCCACGNGSDTLNVHHRYYISGRNIWQYPTWSLVTLCERCHKDTHSLNAASISDWERIPAVFTNGNAENWLMLAAVMKYIIERDGAAEMQNLDAVVFEYNKPVKSEGVLKHLSNGLTV